MQAFTPTAPPTTPEHLALITDALCARAAARNKAASMSTQKRRVQFQHELSQLRTSLSSHTNPKPAIRDISNVTNPVSPTGAAAVLHARLTRINPQTTTNHVEEPVFQSDQSRVEAYNHRMSKYRHVASTHTTESPSKKTSSYKQPKPLDVEHVLPPAPVRPAIPSARVVPMIEAHQTATETPPREAVQRPSLVDAVVRAFTKFIDRISEKKDGKDGKDREADAVAVGTAVAQVLAVFTSLGK